MDHEVIGLLGQILGELRAIRVLLEPAPEPAPLPPFDPVSAVANARSVSELKRAGLWKQR